MSPNDKIDPVVNRTRQAREALARKCDCSLDRIYQLLRTMQAEHPQRVAAPAVAPTRPREASATEMGG